MSLAQPARSLYTSHAIPLGSRPGEAAHSARVAGGKLAANALHLGGMLACKAKPTICVMDCPQMVIIEHFGRTWQFYKDDPGIVCAESLMPAHQAALCAYLQLQRFRAALPAA